MTDQQLLKLYEQLVHHYKTSTKEVHIQLTQPTLEQELRLIQATLRVAKQDAKREKND